MRDGRTLTFVRSRLASGATAILYVLLSICICCASAPVSAVELIGEGGCCQSQCLAAATAPSAAIAPGKRIHERPIAIVAVLIGEENDTAVSELEERNVAALHLFVPLTTIQLRI